MSRNIDLLVAELQRIGRGEIVLCSPGGGESLLWVHTARQQVERFIWSLDNPRTIEYVEGGVANATTEARVETLTEAALGIFGLAPHELMQDLRLLGCELLVADGDLLVDGELVSVALVDHDRQLLAALASLNRRTTEGYEYPVFEESELPDAGRALTVRS